MRYASCRVADDIAANSKTSWIDNYPNFASGGSASKTAIQIRSLISIVKHEHKIEIVNNEFTKNSGTKGVIYIDTYDRGTTLPVVIAHNIFTRNAGYFDATAVYIRARGVSGKPVLTTVPDPLNLFCVGYHFEGNTFTENIGCPRYGGALIKMECIDDGTNSVSANDRLTNGQLDIAT